MRARVRALVKSILILSFGVCGHHNFRRIILIITKLIGQVLFISSSDEFEDEHCRPLSFWGAPHKSKPPQQILQYPINPKICKIRNFLLR